MKAKTILSIWCAVLVLAAGACQIVPAPPVETDVQAPDMAADSGPAVITTENAQSLKPVYSESYGVGAVTLGWLSDSERYWTMDIDRVDFFRAPDGEKVDEFIAGEYIAIFDIAPDGSSIAYSNDGDLIILHDMASGEAGQTISPGFPFSYAEFSPDGSQLLVTSLMDIKAALFNVETGAEMGALRGFETAAPAYNAAFGDDGQTLLWFARGTVQPMDIATGEPGPLLSHEDFVTAQAVSSDGAVVATTATATIGGEISPVLTLWDADSGEILRQIAEPGYYSSIDFSPDGSLIAAGFDVGLAVFSVPGGDELFRAESGEVINSIAFSPDGTKLAASSTSGTLTIYTVE